MEQGGDDCESDAEGGMGWQGQGVEGGERVEGGEV